MSQRKISCLDQNTGLSSPYPSSSPVRTFLTQLFSQLEEVGVYYCVLRGYERLPDIVDHDVDLLVPKEDLTGFRQVLSGACISTGWYLVKSVNRFSFHSWYVTSEGNGDLPLLVHIDVWTQIHWKAAVYADEEAILRTRKRHNGIWVASSGSEAAISLLKEYLQSGMVKDEGEGKTKKRIVRLVEEDFDNFLTTLEPCFGEPLSKFMLECARNADWSRLEGQDRKIRKSLILRALARRPFGQLWDWMRFLGGHINDKILHPSGLFVCLIGPDGSGKTTIANSLREEMKDLFDGVRYYHGHWGLLPELKIFYNALASLLGKKRKALNSDNMSYDQVAAPFDLARSLLYVLYYSLEYVLGNFLILRARANAELVLFDRYFYDYMIQPVYSRVPRWLLRLIERFLPRLDILIWLHNEPEVVHQRKPELSVSQIRLQAEVCKSIVERYPNKACVVRTDDEAQATLGLVIKRVFEFMANGVSPKG